MVSLIPYAASVLGSICYGSATVLEQAGVKKEKHLTSINPLKLLKFIKEGPYFVGLLLDLIGWLFFLVAVRSLPLFLVQSFIALSIVISALLDRYWLKHKILKPEKVSILLVILGVVLLSFIAKPSSAIATSNLFKLIIIVGPLLVAILATIILNLKKSAFYNSLISVLVGISFGGTSIVTRIIVFGQIEKQLNQALLLVSLALYGLLAIILLSIVLQRDRINRVNSLILASEVMVPSLIGIAFLGDGIRSGSWYILSVGLIFVVVGALVTSFKPSPNK